MKKPIDIDRLRHILDSLSKIERYLAGFDLDAFAKDEVKIDAVVRNIEIIGEATTCLTRDLKAKYPEVEWRFATATRNRLIHGYFEVDSKIIWGTTQNDLPRFKKDIERIVEELG
ncbi:MAG TPA: DUF86 domain-containing protein [Pyrinomonadaceae bacterium]|nr:DUF86 domain-containing protein [Pyrinomonadaceae bacterium]